MAPTEVIHCRLGYEVRMGSGHKENTVAEVSAVSSCPRGRQAGSLWTLTEAEDRGCPCYMAHHLSPKHIGICLPGVNQLSDPGGLMIGKDYVHPESSRQTLQLTVPK